MVFGPERVEKKKGERTCGWKTGDGMDGED